MNSVTDVQDPHLDWLGSCQPNIDLLIIFIMCMHITNMYLSIKNEDMH
jgi:hypothetical protein